MKPLIKETPTSELHISLSDFIRNYNQNIPLEFPKATSALLNKFKNANTTLFKHGELWSLDLHRKKIMDWLPLNSKPVA